MFLKVIIFFGLFVLGTCFGSFINVLVSRFGKKKKWFQGRSYCDSCQRELSWWENVPAVSFLFLKGKCLTCRSPIPWSYFLVEIFVGLFYIFLFIFLKNSLGCSLFMGVVHYLIFTLLVVVFLFDLKYFIIPDWATFGLVVLTLLVRFNQGNIGSLSYWLPAVGFSFFFLFLFMITKGKGMGFGDVKFGFFMGLFLGWPKIIFSFYISFLTGAIVGVILILLKKRKFGQVVPFGPFLIWSVFLAFFYGDYFTKIVWQWLAK